MTDASTPPPQPDTGFVRKTTVLVLLEIASALGMYILFIHRTDFPLLGVNVLTIFLLALVAGLATRIVLRQRNGFIRVVTGSAVLIIGMTVLGLLSDWRMGFGPLTFSRNTVDWLGLAKLSVGILSFLLVMYAWRKPASVKVGAPPEVVVTPPEPAPRSRPKRKTSKQLHFPVFAPKTTAVKAPKASASAKQLSKPVTKPRRSIFNRKPQVRLAKTEKHICPYCLDPVTRNDSRGVVECDICHTWHHADCWAIAGVCQVPHYNA